MPNLLLLPEALASLIPVAAVAVLAVVLLVFTKGRLAYEPERAATRPSEAVGVAAHPRVQ